MAPDNHGVWATDKDDDSMWARDDDAKWTLPRPEFGKWASENDNYRKADAPYKVSNDYVGNYIPKSHFRMQKPKVLVPKPPDKPPPGVKRKWSAPTPPPAVRPAKRWSKPASSSALDEETVKNIKSFVSVYGAEDFENDMLSAFEKDIDEEAMHELEDEPSRHDDKGKGKWATDKDDKGKGKWATDKDDKGRQSKDQTPTRHEYPRRQESQHGAL